MNLINVYLKKHGDNWWHGFQHGIGLLGLVSNLAYIKNIKVIYIASSYTIKDVGIGCASDPTIDNNLKFLNCKIVHDQYNLSREDKLKLIIEYSKKENIYPTLRVCWEKDGGKNCCRCEKCYRTIYGIIAAGEDPNKYGFIYDKKLNKIARYDILYKIELTKETVTFWKEIQEKLKTNKQILKEYSECEWIINLDFENINSAWRKIRKQLGKFKRAILGRM